jgi:hypothetical protein
VIRQQYELSWKNPSGGRTSSDKVETSVFKYKRITSHIGIPIAGFGKLQEEYAGMAGQ